MRSSSSRCGPSLLLSRESARFYLLGALMAAYMLAGAALFSALERPAELQAHQVWEGTLRDFAQEHNVSHEDLKSLLRHYEDARTAGIRAEQGRSLWDFPGAFYFVGTVVSTIGFGVSAPSTSTGKVLLVFYGLLGCSATLLFFNLFLERLVSSLGLLIFWCRGGSTQHHSELQGTNDDRGSDQVQRPSTYQVALILLCAVVMVACGAAALYSAMEGWTYLEALYFCFVAFSTVGFGDFVSGQRQQHEDTPAYQAANCLLMLLGVCCTYSLFNAISTIIKQGLDWLLDSLAWMRTSICHTIPQIRCLLTLCLPGPEAPVCGCEDNTLHRQHSQVVSSHFALWRSCAPQAMGKCLCDDAHVKTVCHGGH